MCLRRAGAAVLLVAFTTQIPLAGAGRSSAASSVRTSPRRYLLRLSLTATVTGRRYILFPFKGMLRGESNMMLTAAESDGQELSLESIAGPTYLLMTGGRKANEVYARVPAMVAADAVREGDAAISDWAEKYPDWASQVKPEKRKVLPFLLSPDAPGRLFLEYSDGRVGRLTSTLVATYPWPAKPPQEFTMFDGVCASLGLFNHSPFATSTSADPVTFHVAPALKQLCISVLPQVRSDVEFTEHAPLEVAYECQPAKGSALLHCTGHTSPHIQLEKTFVLDSYVRDAARSTADGILEWDTISISLSGQKGNAIAIVLELRRLR